VRQLKEKFTTQGTAAYLSRLVNANQTREIGLARAGAFP
jgi:hypothetical protein